MNKTQLEQMGACAVNAAKSLQTATAQQKNIFFEEAIKLIQKNTNEILDANLQDINDAHSKNKDDAFIDRLRLDNARIDGICDALKEIQTFPDPVGKTLASWKRPNGLQIDRVSTPLGVIGIIFESRPNVASDAAALESDFEGSFFQETYEIERKPSWEYSDLDLLYSNLKSSSFAFESSFDTNASVMCTPFKVNFKLRLMYSFLISSFVIIILSSIIFCSL